MRNNHVPPSGMRSTRAHGWATAHPCCIPQHLYLQVEQLYCGMQRDTFRVQIVAGRAYIVGEMRSYQSRQWHLKIQIQEVAAKHMALQLSSYSTWRLACNQAP